MECVRCGNEFEERNKLDIACAVCRETFPEGWTAGEYQNFHKKRGAINNDGKKKFNWDAWLKSK